MRTVLLRFTSLVAALVLLQGVAISTASAQAYPNKPIRLVVPYASGGQTDLMARLVGGEMQRIAGQQVLVENKPGASGVVAVEYIVKAGADGYAMCFCTTTNILMPAILEPNTQFDPLKVMVPVVQLFDAPTMFVARNGLAANTIQQVIALARANPGKISFGSIGTGTRAPYPVELLRSMAGIDFNMISYKGEQPVLTDLMGDRLDLGYQSIQSALPQIKAGKVKGVGFVGPTRLASLPDMPTVTEALPGYEATVFFGLHVPTGTPQPVIEKIFEFGSGAINTPVVQERLKADILFPIAARPEVYANRIKVEVERWNKVMK